MSDAVLSVRELTKLDIDLVVNYWLTADDTFLEGMGVDLTKMFNRAAWIAMLQKQLDTPIEEKQSYCLIWLVDGKPIGHSNVNKIIFGQEAYMHLHIWYPDARGKGYGVDLIKLSLPYFFKNLQLKKLYCEPYALNASPNKTMEKVGFSFVKEHITIPGTLNFEQPANLWELTYDNFKTLNL